jgi:hypothetical protein
MGDFLQPWHLMVLLFVACLLLLPTILYVLTLTKALNKCSVASRSLEPGMLWLLLVPFVNIVWHFFVVLGMTKTLTSEFRGRNIPITDEMLGNSIGLAMCICGACMIIPFVGPVAWLVKIVLWIIYWTKIAACSRLLDQIPLPTAHHNTGL